MRLLFASLLLLHLFYAVDSSSRRLRAGANRVFHFLSLPFLRPSLHHLRSIFHRRLSAFSSVCVCVFDHFFICRDSRVCAWWASECVCRCFFSSSLSSFTLTSHLRCLSACPELELIVNYCSVPSQSEEPPHTRTKTVAIQVCVCEWVLEQANWTHRSSSTDPLLSWTDFTSFRFVEFFFICFVHSPSLITTTATATTNTTNTSITDHHLNHPIHLISFSLCISFSPSVGLISSSSYTSSASQQRAWHFVYLCYFTIKPLV